MSRAIAFSFLCECLARIASRDQPTSENPGDFRWTTFIALAHEYRVSSAVASVMQNVSSSKSPPREAVAFLSGIADHNRLRNERVRREAIELAGILNEVGVTPLLLKGGAHLFTGLYPDPAIRQMADLDVLVPAGRIDDCVAALKDRDFTQLNNYRHPRSHHYPALGRPDLPVSIELHHTPLAYPHCEFLTCEEIYSSARRSAKDDVHLMVPSPTCAVMHNIAHAQLNDHDCLYGRVDLRGLLDFALLSSVHAEKIDWDLINKKFGDGGHRHALEYHLLWARHLGAKVPSLVRASAISRLLHKRALYQASKPKVLSLSFRLLRPFVLLHRELSDPALRRRLAANLVDLDWWRRHLRMLTDA